MSGKLCNEIPNRIIKCLVHASFYTLSKKQRTVLVLTNQLHFFEVKSKEIIFAIDIGETILKELSLSIANLCPSQQHSGADRGSSSTVDSEEQNPKRNVFDDNITIRSYIYYQGSLKRYFILLKAYDKLVVIERCANGFKLVSQHNNVDKVEVVDPQNTFRPIVSITFCSSSECLRTTFVDCDTYKSEASSSSSFTESEMFKQINEKIKDARTELSTQQLFTKQDFIKLKTSATFGPNFIRSPEIEEKQPLGKYGDVWIKLNDPYFVIGIPVINNASQR